MMTEEEKRVMKERDIEMWYMRLDGATFREIAKKYKISISRVSQIVKCRDKRLNDYLNEAYNASKKEDMEKRISTTIDLKNGEELLVEMTMLPLNFKADI